MVAAPVFHDSMTEDNRWRCSLNFRRSWVLDFLDVYSLHNYGKSPFFMGKLTISMAIPRKHPMNMGQNEETHGSNQEEIRSGSRVGPLAFSGVAGLGSHGKLQKDVELYEMSRKMMASSSFEWKNLWDYHSVNGRFFNIHVSLREGSGLWACMIGRSFCDILYAKAFGDFKPTPTMGNQQVPTHL